MATYSGAHNLEVMADAVNYNRYLLQLVLERARIGDRILDFGAGTGTFARTLLAEGRNICCVEPDRDQARRLAADGLTVFERLDQIADDSLDYVYTLNVLEHLEFDTVALREINRKLRPGGRLLIYVPAFNLLFSSLDRRVGHHRRYTRHGLEQITRVSGFHIVRARYCDSLGFPAALLYRWVGNSSGDLNRRAVLAYDRLAFPLSRLADVFLSRFIGKNLVLFARKDGPAADTNAR